MHTVPLKDLDRKDAPPSPFGPRTDAVGWTVTPYENGTYSSYTPLINQQMAEEPAPSGDLFRPVVESVVTPTKMTSNLPNGIVPH